MSIPVNSDSTRRLVSPGTGNGRSDTVLLTDSASSPGESSERAPGGTEPARTAPPDSESTCATLHGPESARLAALSTRYDILSEAGHGSMGNVYRARDRETGEIIALKLLKQEISSDQTMIDRFKNELLFARRITHKNVCRMYDFNRIDGTGYTSMEYVEGESLRSALNRFGGLAVRKALNVALQICSGLREAHAQGIVHRDLKPENVMIDRHGNVKIMDFGIARSMEAATRLTGSMMGTPAYMAPEQVTGKLVDYRTDIYALGLILYEMFTGAQACQAETPVAAAMKQIRETPPLPHELDPTIPVGIEKTILKCLEKDPAKRFQSVAELEKALSAPGITGISRGSAAPARLSVPTPLPTPLSATVPARKSVTRSAEAAPPRTRRVSPLLWTLLAALLVIAALAGAQWVKITRSAELIQLPAPLPAPKPPALASRLTVSADASTTAQPDTTPSRAHISEKTGTLAKSSVATSETIRSTPGPLSAEGSKPPVDTEVFPRVERPARKSARQIELEKTVPADVQQRADSAFGETTNPAADASASELIWIGRYERKERADDAVQTIRNLGLPARSVARRPWGKSFWVVLAGPFTPKRAPDVVNWLKSQGFKGAHEFHALAAAGQHRPEPK